MEACPYLEMARQTGLRKQCLGRTAMGLARKSKPLEATVFIVFVLFSFTNEIQ